MTSSAPEMEADGLETPNLEIPNLENLEPEEQRVQEVRDRRRFTRFLERPRHHLQRAVELGVQLVVVDELGDRAFATGERRVRGTR